MNNPRTKRYCGHCGGDLQEEVYDGGPVPPSYAHQPDAHQPDAHQTDAHQGCAHHLEMEPPRYCSECRRRLKVQVSPLGWRAECSRHGITVA